MGTLNNGRGLDSRQRRGLKILVVDDDDLNQRLLNLVLARDNNFVTFSYDGYDAIKILEQESFDLIFMDIQIPRINGFEVCEFLRRGETVNRNVPIVVLTALPSRNEKVQFFLDRGMFSQCIHKPFDVQQIQDILVAVAEREKVDFQWVQPAKKLTDDSLLVLNVEKALPVFSDDIHIYKELLGDFLEKLPERIRNIRQCAEKDDWRYLSVLAHNLTGITRNFGAEKLSGLAEQLDNEAVDGNAPIVHRLVVEITECVPELEKAYSLLEENSHNRLFGRMV